jgi:hypothetical protein
MKIASSTPESSGSDLVQYRCEQCGRIELVRLIRRSRDEDESEELFSRYLSRKGLQRLIAARPRLLSVTKSVSAPASTIGG